MKAVAEVVRLLREASEIDIVRVKDRFTTPSASGWRDVMINYKLRGDGHCCEVQICHKTMLAAREGLPGLGHVIYGRVRNANEILERLGLLDEGTHRLRQPPTGCKQVGVSCQQAKMMGLELNEIKEAQYTCKEALEAGYSLHELQQVYTPEQIGKGMLRELKEGGTTCLQAKKQGYTLSAIRAANFSWEEVKTARYSCKEAWEADYSLPELRQAYQVEDIGGVLSTLKHDNGMKCKQAKEQGYTLKEIKAAGYGCKEAQGAGWSPEDGAQAGYACCYTTFGHTNFKVR